MASDVELFAVITNAIKQLQKRTVLLGDALESANTSTLSLKHEIDAIKATLSEIEKKELFDDMRGYCRWS